MTKIAYIARPKTIATEKVHILNNFHPYIECKEGIFETSEIIHESVVEEYNAMILAANKFEEQLKRTHVGYCKLFTCRLSKGQDIYLPEHKIVRRIKELSGELLIVEGQSQPISRGDAIPFHAVDEFLLLQKAMNALELDRPKLQEYSNTFQTKLLEELLHAFLQ